MQSTPTRSDRRLTFEVQSLFSGTQRQKGKGEKNPCLKSPGLFNNNSCKLPPLSTGAVSASSLNSSSLAANDSHGGGRQQKIQLEYQPSLQTNSHQGPNPRPARP